MVLNGVTFLFINTDSGITSLVLRYQNNASSMSRAVFIDIKSVLSILYIAYTFMVAIFNVCYISSLGCEGDLCAIYVSPIICNLAKVSVFILELKMFILVYDTSCYNSLLLIWSEAVESWRKEKLEEAKKLIAEQTIDNGTLSFEDAGMEVP